MKQIFKVNTLMKIILLIYTMICINYGVDLSQHFELPLCCYENIQYRDTETAQSLQNEFKSVNTSSETLRQTLGLYKMVVSSLNSTVVEKNQSKKYDTDDKSNVMEMLDRGENQNLEKNSKVILPPDWQNQLRLALYESMSPKALKRNESWTNDSELWKQLKNAPLEIIDPLTGTVSILQTQPDLSKNFSGVVVNTKSGLEMRTSGSSSNLIASNACDCPLIQRGDMLLAYWAVNNKLIESGESVFEYQIYPVAHNVPTPPIFIPFVPDVSFKPSPIDLNSEEYPPEFHNLENLGLTNGKIVPHIGPHGDPPYHLNQNFPPIHLPIFIPKINSPEILHNVIETPDGYTPEFLDWYHSVLEKQFRSPRQLIPFGHFGVSPNFHPNLPNIDHPLPFRQPRNEQLPQFQHQQPYIDPSQELLPLPISNDAGPGLGHRPSGPLPIQFNPEYMPNIANQEQIVPEFHKDTGEEDVLPLSIPMAPLINHPHSIQEIISGQNSLVFLEDEKEIQERPKQSRDCSKNHDLTNYINCKDYQSNDKIGKSISFTPKKIEKQKLVQNSKESSYILNF